MTANDTELLAPAGDFDTALAAFAAGADAVYCGMTAFSARAFAKNLDEPDLRALARVAKARSRKIYVTLNTVVEEDEMDRAAEQLALLDDIGVDGVIVQDLGVARIAREFFPSLALHASTQLVAHNLEGVLALKELGFVRAVLARELTLAEIESIAKRGGIEIECFIHGALCYSLSGLCLFSAMENGRSGNRGRCAYCCRMAGGDAKNTFPFSMRDLRLGADARLLAAAGVKSLKIEGRMKSPLYVASAVRHYREILDGSPSTVSTADLETVFSRRTTKLYLHGRTGEEDVLDSSSLGHVGTEIGTVKRVTRDREGRAWLRFHSNRPLERHDGLQIVARDGAKKCGFGIGEMRLAISRSVAFSAEAHSDVEVLLTGEQAAEIAPGDTVCCSMSNEMKRRFPVPSHRASNYSGTTGLDVALAIAPHEISAEALGARVTATGEFAAAKNPAATREAAEKAFSRLGGTDYFLSSLALDDPQSLFAPAGVLNDLRRRLVARLDEDRTARREAKVAAAMRSLAAFHAASECGSAARRARIRVGQQVPEGDWAEVVILVGADSQPCDVPQELASRCRLALPVFTPDAEFARLRHMVKRHLREGFAKWEASDLATLRMLKSLGVADVTADWTLYAFNSAALAALRSLGVSRVVASPENTPANLAALADSGAEVEFLERQATPLFISLNKPGDGHEPFVVRRQDPLWITARREPRRFETPPGVSTRFDISWDE